MEKTNFNNNLQKDFFHEEIYPIFKKDFLLGNNYEEFAKKVSEKFTLNSEQWGNVLECWEQKEDILSNKKL